MLEALLGFALVVVVTERPGLSPGAYSAWRGILYVGRVRYIPSDRTTVINLGYRLIEIEIGRYVHKCKMRCRSCLPRPPTCTTYPGIAPATCIRTIITSLK